MKAQAACFIILILTFLNGCKTSVDSTRLSDEININFNEGNYSTVRKLTDSLKKYCYENQELVTWADSLEQITMRTELDFSLKKDEIISQINKGRGSISPGEMAALEEKG